jgi:hypothetical protein
MKRALSRENTSTARKLNKRALLGAVRLRSFAPTTAFKGSSEPAYARSVRFCLAGPLLLLEIAIR